MNIVQYFETTRVFEFSEQADCQHSTPTRAFVENAENAENRREQAWTPRTPREQTASKPTRERRASRPRANRREQAWTQRTPTRVFVENAENADASRPRANRRRDQTGTRADRRVRLLRRHRRSCVRRGPTTRANREQTASLRSRCDSRTTLGKHFPELVPRNSLRQLRRRCSRSHLLLKSVKSLCHILEPIYKTSIDWIAVKSLEALANFIL
ncbi:hypothetical protein M5K25_023633 [Dendrobium thyrsiflorum]|uniref:Uncharacterized protein n=1 Tax=Dendrobium thyrsiflorum TaxID=117978 RepID=A0ABD0U8J5_DENTH